MKVYFLQFIFVCSICALFGLTILGYSKNSDAVNSDNQLFSVSKDEQTAIFAGGCFWGVEAVFEHVKGVSNVKSGYTGGSSKTANYEAVSNGDTKHAESVIVTFNPQIVSYQQLLKVFFFVAHNPTELNKQGPDFGTQYRSTIFFKNEEQQKIAQSYIEELTNSKTFKDPIVTQIVPLEKFYVAENYHQDYLVFHPDDSYIVVHDKPKLDNLRKQYPDLYSAKRNSGDK